MERIGKRVIQLVRRPNLAAPRDIQRSVRDDPVQPCPKRLIHMEPVERLIRPQESFLHRVFGVLVSRDDRTRNRVRSPLVQLHQLTKRALITTLCGDDELALVSYCTRRGWQTLTPACHKDNRRTRSWSPL
jgi:hypothetical protein